MADATSSEQQAILKVLNGVQLSSFGDDDHRRKAVLLAAKKLVERLETPKEKIVRVFGTQPRMLAVLKVALDIDLFIHLNSPKESSSADTTHTKTLQELARLTGMDPVLLKRILNLFCAAGFIIEVPFSENPSGDGKSLRYAATRLSRTLAHPVGRSMADFHYFVNDHIDHSLPSYLKSIGYKNPDTLKASAFQYAVEGGEGTSYWDWIEQRDEVRQSFQNMMAFFSTADVLEDDTAKESPAPNGAVTTTKHLLLTRVIMELLSKKDPELNIARPLVVDVGGGQGHDIANILKHSPNIQGRLVLEDAPHIIAKAQSSFKDTEVELISHDFFEPQPAACEGSRIYHLGSVLHDWPDLECRKILQNIRAAMKDGYSCLLLHETVLPESGLTVEQTLSDLLMMYNFSAGERTRAEFDTLLKSAGLQLQSISEDVSELRKVIVVVPI